MATTKKSAVKDLKATAPPKPLPQKASVKSNRVLEVKNSEDLVAENIAALSNVAASLEVTMEMLVQKVAGMAHHIIATEEILAELVASNGLNLARVNARIRAKIAAGTDNSGNPNPAIDVAASIASPLPR